MLIDRIIAVAENKSWKVEKYDELQNDFPSFLDNWKTEINESFFQFISNIKILENKDQTVWMLTMYDYTNTAESAFSWDEFRKLSLSFSVDENEKEKINAFWSEYLPVCISVGDGYSYYAIDRHGNVVKGMEPEFENIEFINISYESFVENLILDNI